MTAPKVEGHCDPKFSKLADIFSASIKSGFDDGGSLCLEVENEVVIDMWGGFKDQEHTKPWEENTIANVVVTSNFENHKRPTKHFTEFIERSHNACIRVLVYAPFQKNYLKA